MGSPFKAELDLKDVRHRAQSETGNEVFCARQSIDLVPQEALKTRLVRTILRDGQLALLRAKLRAAKPGEEHQ